MQSIAGSNRGARAFLHCRVRGMRIPPRFQRPLPAQQNCCTEHAVPCYSALPCRTYSVTTPSLLRHYSVNVPSLFRHYSVTTPSLLRHYSLTESPGRSARAGGTAVQHKHVHGFALGGP
jgi:hypothetical protein